MSYDWLGTLRHAKSFLEAGITLHDKLDNPSTLTPPIYFLYHHSAELLLKSFLQASGLNAKQLKRVGHQMGNLLERARADGLEISLESAKYINMIPQSGGQVEIKYYSDGWVTLLAPNYSKSAVLKLFIEVAPQVFVAGHYPMPDWFLRSLGNGSEPPRDGWGVR